MRCRLSAVRQPPAQRDASLGQGVVEFKKGLQGIEDDVKNSTHKIEEQPSKPQAKEEAKASRGRACPEVVRMCPVFAFLDNPLMLLMLGALAVLLFGERLPEVARSFGKGLMEFKNGVRGIQQEIEGP